MSESGDFGPESKRGNLFVAGSIAGALARAAVLPIDMGGQKGPVVTLFRRSVHWGLVFSLYITWHQEKYRAYDAKQKWYRRRAWDAFVCGGTAGLLARFLTAPLYRVADHAEFHSVTQAQALRHIVTHQGGVLGLWQNQHPLLAAFWHTGSLFMFFEIGRRTADNLGIEANPATNAVIGGCASALSSTITYKWSWRRYQYCVLNDSAIIRGLLPTLAKEVPMTAAAFGAYTALQPIIAPGYKNHGFGAWV
jgi:hypothetical protein